MKQGSDLALVALRVAAAPTLEKIEADRQQALRSAPNSQGRMLAKFLGDLKESLFQPGLSLCQRRKALGLRDNSLSRQFQRFFSMPPSRYVELCRLMTADRLLRDSQLQIAQIATLVGYQHPDTFSRRFQKWCSDRPSDVIKNRPPPEIDYLTWRRLWAGDLDGAEKRRVLATVLDWLGPEQDAEDPEQEVGDADFREMLDGPRHERGRALRLWKAIQERPLEEQKRQVAWHLFRTTALFDLLREKSITEGRGDRQRGVRIAELALESLAGCGEALSSRRHDLRALGLAQMGNARRLTLEFAKAEEALQAAWAEWQHPRPERDSSVLADIYLNHGTLRMCQRSYDEALEMVGHSLDLARELNSAKGQALALIQRASIYGYMERYSEAVADLEATLSSLKGQEPFLTYAACKNLANTYERGGDYKTASLHFKHAESAWPRKHYPRGEFELSWLAGHIAIGQGNAEEAADLYGRAQEGFEAIEDLTSVALILLHKATLFAQRSNPAEALKAAARSILLLESLQLNQETLTAIRILAQAVTSQDLTCSLLRETQRQIAKDPLLHLT